MNNITFLQDEVRSGFYIPTAIKQAWGAQLKILGEIDRICEKYNIQYFADWGTFLGAVRHGGFVPWDDDMDICMKREDYERFKQVALKELPKGYAIHNYETKEDHWLFLARVVNSNSICFDKEHLDSFNNFPYIATVDIFVLDYLYKDEQEELNRCDEVKHILAVADGIVENKLSPITVQEQLKQLEEKYNTPINRKQDNRGLGIELYRLAEKQMARVKEADADRIGQIFPWILSGRKGFPKEYYQKSVRLPFENTTIPVSKQFHSALSNHYGNYFPVKKVWNGHDYPYFEGQRKNLQAVADFKLPEFTFEKGMLRESLITGGENTNIKASSLKAMTRECLDELERSIQQAIDDICEEKYDEAFSILPECQQLAVDLGTLIENVKGTERDSCKKSVASLEEFCEALYKVYECLEQGTDIDTLNACIGTLVDAINSAEEIIDEQIIKREEVLFVTTGAKHFNSYKEEYESLPAKGDKDIYIVAVPVMTKDAYGQINMTDEEIIAATNLEAYPEELDITSWTDYDITLHQPEIIYIQDAYDDENPCLTIPPAYYAKNMRDFTEQLIYMPALSPDDFYAEDVNDWYNMKHYVTAPGVVYADMVIVNSKVLRERYIEKLTEFAGIDTKAHWEKTVIVKPDSYEIDETPNRIEKNDKETQSENDTLVKKERTNKKILFCITSDFFAEEISPISKLKEKFAIFAENYPQISVDVCVYPYDEIMNNNTGNKWYEELLKLLEGYSKEEWLSAISIKDMSQVQNIIKDYAAYYGGASPLVHQFMYRKKPVMLADII